jgi:hypothetical protein
MSDWTRTRPLGVEDVLRLFNNIIGLDEVKDVLAHAVLTPNPVAVLLIGPPQSAKTLILERLAAYYRFNNGIPYTFDDRVTPVGLARLLFNHRNSPAVVFDELDKAKPKVLAVFNEAVESRRVTFLNARNIAVVKLRNDMKFFCGGNSEKVLQYKAVATLSRFLKVRIKEYDRDMFVDVMTMLLTQREYGDFSPSDARRIAEYAWDSGFRDIRQLRELGKIYPRQPEKMINFIEYSRSIPRR